MVDHSDPTTPAKEPTRSNPRLETALARAREAHTSGEIARAHALYVRASEIDSTSAAAWTGRASTAEDVDDAIRSWCAAAALDPENHDVLAELEKRVQEKLSTSRADTVPSMVSLAKVLAEAGQKTSAYSLTRRATELNPQSEPAWVWRAGLTDDLEEMTSCLKQAIALNPDSQQAKAGLEWSQSVQTDRETKDKPDATSSRGALEEGQAALKRGDKTRARELFRQATELDAKNEQAWLWRGSITSDTDEALSFIEQALTINPNNQSAQEARSWLNVKKLRESTRDAGAALPVTAPRTVKPRPTRRTSRSARIVPLSFLVLALLILVLALLYARGF